MTQQARVIVAVAAEANDKSIWTCRSASFRPAM